MSNNYISIREAARICGMTILSMNYYLQQAKNAGLIKLGPKGYPMLKDVLTLAQK